MKISAPWAIGIADCYADDYQDKRILKAWIWADRVQWICLTYVGVEIARWLLA